MTIESASTTGYRAPASTTGNRAPASTTGNRAPASTTGNMAPASTTGNRAPASTTGNMAPASTTGNMAPASTTGYRAPASAIGKGSIAATLSPEGFARCGVDGAVIITYRDGLGRPCILVGHEHRGEVTAGVWYAAEDGALVAHRDLLTIDMRGYQLRYNDGRYVAGCRDFDAAEALEHWSDEDHADPTSAKILHDAVVANEARLAAMPIH